MTFKREENCLTLCVPHANNSVGTSGEEHSSVEAECERLDDSWMAHEPEPSFACPGIEDLNSISSVRWESRHKATIVIKDTVVKLSELIFYSCADVEYF